MTKFRRKFQFGTALILLAYIAFISLGLPDGLLGVAWPSMRHSFSRSLDSLGMLLFASTIGYLVSSFFSGHILSRLGVGWLLSVSCAATGAGLLGYTLVPSWWLLIPLAVVAGLGAGAIDAGINTYVAANYGERLMQWLHASFGIGITLGPVIMTAGIAYFNTWRWGYVLVGAAQLLLALCFGLTSSVWHNGSKTAKSGLDEHSSGRRIPLAETLRQYRVWLSILLFFIYSGIEASIGSWAYTLLTESRGIPPGLAGLWVGSYWAAFTIGRILAGFLSKHFGINSLIKLCLLAAFSGAVLLMWNPFGLSSLLAVAIIGFVIAPIFPGMVSLTSRRVGERYAAITIGMQISAAGLGVAIIPALTGILAQRTSLEVIPLLIILWTILLLGLYSFAMKNQADLLTG